MFTEAIRPTVSPAFSVVSAVLSLTMPTSIRLLVVSYIVKKYDLLLVIPVIFVVPIAAAGLLTMEGGANPDLFVITIPLAADRVALSVFAFIGGLSSQSLVRVDLNGTQATKGDQWPMGARIRDVAEGPDGAIWVIEDGAKGRLLKLTPRA